MGRALKVLPALCCKTSAVPAAAVCVCAPPISQDSIGGNAKTVIVANVSPSEACQQETLSTLGFAARARKIVNKVRATLSLMVL